MQYIPPEVTPLRRDQDEHPSPDSSKPPSPRRKIIKLIFGVLCTVGIVVGWVSTTKFNQLRSRANK